MSRHEPLRRARLRRVTSGAVGAAIGVGLTVPLGPSEPVHVSSQAETRPVTPPARQAVRVRETPLARPSSPPLPPAPEGRPPTVVEAIPIPAPALAAYQRAAAAIDQAAPGCHLEWELLAGVGLVESGHGSVDGSGLNEHGVARPSIIGSAEAGRRSELADSDAGRLDGDATDDLPVGPMHLLPSSWSVVAVDGDGDGRRNPQDIDDASLGAAILLCVRDRDLSQWRNRRLAVAGYNPDADYVSAVMQARRSYLTPAFEPVEVSPAVSTLPSPDETTPSPLPTPAAPTTPPADPTWHAAEVDGHPQPGTASGSAVTRPWRPHGQPLGPR